MVAERLRVLVVAGIGVGVLVGGVGSRLAMLLLRVTSHDNVRGITSDDGFTIGTFTLSGTYNLLLLGALVGIIGAAAYRAVAPWLIGPRWFRDLTVGAASGAVVGSMLVHADGVDFTLLQPTWLAIGLFVALPALFAVAMAHAVEAVSAPGSWTAVGRRRWVLPVVLVLVFPLTIPVVLLAAAVVVVWAAAVEAGAIEQVRRVPGVGLAVRAAWLTVAVLGLVALVRDIEAIA
jgi:hypothetical protein